MKADLLQFGLPAIVVFAAGLLATARTGWHGMLSQLWRIAKDPKSVMMLSAMEMFGMILFLAGLGTAIYAVTVLGRSYRSTLVIFEDHKLVTRGVYSRVRHPIYLGVLVGCVGIPINGHSAFGLLVMLLLVPIFLNRIRLEEQLLTDEYGDEYRAYQARTKKLVPFLY